MSNFIPFISQRFIAENVAKRRIAHWDTVSDFIICKIAQNNDYHVLYQ